jgi:N-methylhydantoinase A
VDAASKAIERQISRRLRLGLHEAALAILNLVSEQMAHAIEDVTINQGIDPAAAVLVGGGGAAGLNAIAIARRLRCPRVIVPLAGSALSAAGALMADLSREYSATCFTTSPQFQAEAVNATLETLESRCRSFAAGPGLGSLRQDIELSVEARYPHQVWEVTVPLRVSRFQLPADLEHLVEDMHVIHQELFAVSDRASPIEFVTWTVRIHCRLPNADEMRVMPSPATALRRTSRQAYFPDVGMTDAAALHWQTMTPEEPLTGPAIIESDFTTVVVDPGAQAERCFDGSVLITPQGSRISPGRT